MSKAKFETAKQLLKERDYDQARSILETIEHPTAQQWLTKIDRLQTAEMRAISNAGQFVSNLGIPDEPFVCPNCFERVPHDTVTAQEIYTNRCPNCLEIFSTQIFVIGSMASERDKKDRNRTIYKVRAVDMFETPKEMNFASYLSHDIDLDAGDMVAFTSQKSTLRIVQNFDKDKYWRLTKTATEMLKERRQAMYRNIMYSGIAVILLLIVGVVVWQVAF